MRYLTIPLALLLCLATQAHVVQSASTPIAFAENDDTNEDYHAHEILGFTVHMSSETMNDKPELAESALWMVRSKLQRIIEVIPMNKVKLLRTVEIWLNDYWEEEDDLCGWACYVPKNYAGTGRFYRDRQGTVIVRDLDFLLEAAWCCSSGTFLHEMAHAYHDQFIEDGYYNTKIYDEYEDAKDSGDYDDNRVLYPWWEDQYVEHYGMTSATAFFATMTETYFLGSYRTFPHNIRDLYSYDRSVYRLINNAWFSNDIDGDTVSFSEATEIEIPGGLQTPEQ